MEKPTHTHRPADGSAFSGAGGADGGPSDGFQRLGADIGAYDTCGHLCRYCYANNDIAQVPVNRKQHNPNSQFLIGDFRPGDIIHDVEQKSWTDGQMDIFQFI